MYFLGVVCLNVGSTSSLSLDKASSMEHFSPHWPIWPKTGRPHREQFRPDILIYIIVTDNDTNSHTTIFHEDTKQVQNNTWPETKQDDTFTTITRRRLTHTEHTHRAFDR